MVLLWAIVDDLAKHHTTATLHSEIIEEGACNNIIISEYIY